MRFFLDYTQVKKDLTPTPADVERPDQINGQSLINEIISISPEFVRWYQKRSLLT